MQCIAYLALEPAAIHPVIRLQMANGRLHSLPTLEPPTLLRSQRLVLAAMDDLHIGIVAIYAAIAQIHYHLFGDAAYIFEQDAGLLQLCRENVAIVRVARKGPRSHHQAALVRHGDTGFDAELVRLSGFAFTDTLDFRGMQGIKLVLVFPLLGADTFSPIEQRVQAAERGDAQTGCYGQLAPDFAQDNAKDGALPCDRTAQELELFGMGIAASFAAQRLAFLAKGLLQGDTGTPGCLHDLGAGNVKQAAVHRVGNGFLLHGRVDDDALEFCRTNCFGLHRRVDGCLKQFFNAGFTNGGAKATKLGGIARQFRRVVVLTAEVLPYDVLGPPGDEFFVTEVEGVLEVKQSGHEPYWQAWPARCTEPGAGDLQARAKEIAAGYRLTSAVLACKGRCQGGFDLRPRHPLCQHSKRVSQIDHVIKPGSEKIVSCHLRCPSISLRFQ